MADRKEEIIKLVSEYKKVEVNWLAEKLNVSKVTIRKDLDALEQKGLVQRKHGYALIGNQDNINFRLAINYETKMRIAAEAAEEVANGETIMIESGATCCILAETIFRTKRDVTIITNSSFIASNVEANNNCQIILIGGNYQQDSQVCVGPMAKMNIQQFYVDKLFVGIDGFDEQLGYSNSNLMRSEIVRAMAEVSNRVIILTDSSKFRERGLIKTFSLEEVDTIYTDADLDSEKKQFIERHGTKVICV